MTKFIATDINRIGKKRKETLRACEKCRTRKKRCDHRLGLQGPNERRIQISDVSTDHISTSIATDLVSSSEPRDNHRPEEREHSSAAEKLQEVESNLANTQPFQSRFVGYLNPEGIVRATDLECPGDGVSSAGVVGVWHSEKLEEPGRDSARFRVPSPPGLFDGFPSVSRKVVLPILKDECLSCLPNSEYRGALQAIYFKKVHPIFPIINKDVYGRLQDHSAPRILLEQGMCLAASTDSDSRPYLLMPDNSQPLSLKDFNSRIFSAMRIAIEIGLITDNLIVIQALALMSLFANGRKSSQTSALMVGQAVQRVHFLGLHMQERDGEPDSDHAKTLFCCVWAIDRLHAALHGRPVMMNEKDVGRALQKCFDAQPPVFKLFLNVINLLDRTIKQYYPRDPAIGLLEDFPLFEDLITTSDAHNVPKTLLTTIEILYYAVAILSHRSKPGDTGVVGSTASRTRQGHAAEKITAIVSHEPHDQLSLFPFIPYAVSLSLSVAYREMRQSKVPMYRSRAQNAMEINCRLLANLGEIFWSAEAMAELGNMTLKELSRVYSDVADADTRKEQLTTDLGSDLNLSSRAHDADIHERNPSSLPEEPYPFDFTGLPDLDPFEIFDPGFNLDSVDAYLDGYLDLTSSMHRC